MQAAEIYTAVATRLLELAPQLTDAQQSVMPAPTPEWTVVDTYRHLVGATADMLDGRVEGRGTEEWTAAQLAARADCSLAELCAEWSKLLPDMAAMMDAEPGLLRLSVGYWLHEQDVRVALGIRALRDDPHLAVMTTAFLEGRVQPYADRGAPTLRAVATDRDVEIVLGPGEPALTLRAPAFELLRMIASRRSEAQCLAADWAGGDGAARSAAIRALAAFPLPTADLTD